MDPLKAEGLLEDRGAKSGSLEALHSTNSKISKQPTVTFSTSCWEHDWRQILLNSDYLAEKQIGNNCYPFDEKVLFINNVKDLAEVKQAAQKWVDRNILTKIIVIDDVVNDMMTCFNLKKGDFRAYTGESVNDEWIYYNAIGPLCSIYTCQTDYLLHMTGDSRLNKPVKWVAEAIQLMERNDKYKVANLTWNNRYDEAKNESYQRHSDFYVAKQGFTDQQFLIPVKDFRAQIYSEIRHDSSHYPKGDIFEKRVFSAMKNRGWERLIYQFGSYIHENF